MDSVTQLVLGAGIGYAVSGRQLGKSAFAWGALAGTIPDLDFLATLPFQDEFRYLQHHRGITHSVLFSVLAPMGIARFMACWNRWKPNVAAFRRLFMWGFVTHAILDCFTSWGTQLLWPLSNRIAWHSIFIVDPLYTIPFIALLLIAMTRSQLNQSLFWTYAALGISSLYLGWTVCAKAYIHHQFTQLFRHHRIAVTSMITRPTPFNTVLWSATAHTADGYYYALISLFDSQSPELFFLPKTHTIPDHYRHSMVSDLIDMTLGFYTLEATESGLTIHDLRYGFMSDPLRHGPSFVFSYHVAFTPTKSPQLRIQNPRPTNPLARLDELRIRALGI